MSPETSSLPLWKISDWHQKDKFPNLNNWLFSYYGELIMALFTYSFIFKLIGLLSVVRCPYGPRGSPGGVLGHLSAVDMYLISKSDLTFIIILDQKTKTNIWTNQRTYDIIVFFHLKASWNVFRFFSKMWVTIRLERIAIFGKKITCYHHDLPELTFVIITNLLPPWLGRFAILRAVFQSGKPRTTFWCFAQDICNDLQSNCVFQVNWHMYKFQCIIKRNTFVDIKSPCTKLELWPSCICSR